jgi:hypothetical protein
MVGANVKLALTYFLNDDVSSEWLRLVPVWGSSEKPDGTYQRLQMDFNVKF